MHTPQVMKWRPTVWTELVIRNNLLLNMKHITIQSL